MSYQDILAQILYKLGKTYDELTPMAQSTYDSWEKVLSGEPMTLERLATFMGEEVERIVDELAGQHYEITSKVDSDMKARLWWGRFILNSLKTPDQMAKNLVAYLKKQHNIK